MHPTDTEPALLESQEAAQGIWGLGVPSFLACDLISECFLF